MGKKIFRNGNIFTSDDEMPYAESFVTEDGIITWIGNDCDLPETTDDVAGTDIQVIDLEGQTVIPGFIDSHMHPVILAGYINSISCLPPEIRSIEELTAAIRKKAQTAGPGEWIKGWGYDEEKFAEHRAPTRWDLDKGSEDIPVCLLRSCTHVRSVNSKALELAGITRDTPDPPGGEIDRDENGEPTGILRENAAHLVDDVMPEMSKEELIDSIVKLGSLLLSQGITAVCDMGNLEPTDYYKYYEEAAKKGFRQSVGIYYMWGQVRDRKDFSWSYERTRRDRQIFDAGIKLVGDGSVGGRTAWMDRPYKGSDDEYGICVCSDEEINTAMDFCKENKCQLSFHAMGKRTIDKITSRADTEQPWITDRPHIRLEHVTDPSEKAIQTMAKKKIAVSTQAIFMYSEIESYLNNLGEDWLHKTYPIKHMLEKGVKVALSTDAPATSWAVPSDPFPNIKSAVTRYAYDGTDCGRENRIDTGTAIKLYTREGAHIAGFEKMGMLKRGFKANFAVLSEDIFKVRGEDIDRVFVTETYIDGEQVYAETER